MRIKQRDQHKENKIRDLNPFTHGLITLFFILGAGSLRTEAGHLFI